MPISTWILTVLIAVALLTVFLYIFFFIFPDSSKEEDLQWETMHQKKAMVKK